MLTPVSIGHFRCSRTKVMRQCILIEPRKDCHSLVLPFCPLKDPLPTAPLNFQIRYFEHDENHPREKSPTNLATASFVVGIDYQCPTRCCGMFYTFRKRGDGDKNAQPLEGDAEHTQSRQKYQSWERSSLRLVESGESKSSQGCFDDTYFHSSRSTARC